MYKVLAPNAQYTGKSAGVEFINGIGFTDNERTMHWFISHNYAVVDLGDTSIKSNFTDSSKQIAEIKDTINTDELAQPVKRRGRPKRC